MPRPRHEFKSEFSVQTEMGKIYFRTKSGEIAPELGRLLISQLEKIHTAIITARRQGAAERLRDIEKTLDAVLQNNPDKMVRALSERIKDLEKMN